jgi:poly(hydroxyalkanoate) depolymerase family esterase
VPPTIDVVPEAVEVAGAERDGPERPVRARLPDVLLHLLDRVAPSGFEPGAGGLADPSAADIPVPGVGQFLAKSFSNQAGSRAYKLYVPSQYRGQALPLIVMLHGCTQSPNDFAAGTRMNLRAEEYNCFVAYPEQSASANISKCWNWFRPGDQIRGQGEPALIAGITRQVMSDYSVDEERIYAAGLSAGGAAAAVLAAAYPDLYAAIGVHSGLACGVARDVPSAFAAMRQSQPGARRRSDNNLSGRGGYSRVVPAIVFHGDQDTTVHTNNGDQVIAQLREVLDTDVKATVERGRIPGGRTYTRTVHRDAADNSIFSSGSSTVPVMPGQAAASLVPTPIRGGRMQHGKCSASFSITHSADYSIPSSSRASSLIRSGPQGGDQTSLTRTSSTPGTDRIAVSTSPGMLAATGQAGVVRVIST